MLEIMICLKMFGRREGTNEKVGEAGLKELAFEGDGSDIYVGKAGKWWFSSARYKIILKTNINERRWRTSLSPNILF